MCATLICKPHVSESIITTRRLAPLVALLILLTLAGNNVIWAAISEDEIDDVSNLPGQGFNSIQYNPVTRQLTQIVWMETTDQFELLYLAREPNGTWSQELIIESDSGSYTWSSPAQLLYTSDGTPRIFLVDPDDDDLINHYQREAGGWQQVEVITIPDEPAFDFWAETLYVTLNGTARVDNDNPDAATVMTWTPWNIQLSQFADQGINLANVNSITLGLSSVTGGTGTMYFDDIRLYAPAQ